MSAPPRPLRRRVLVADDTRLGRALTAHLLASLGCEVDLAEDGLAALGAVAGADYDAIFMDAEMPVMDGTTATRLLRDRYGARCPPIVAATAHADPLTHDALVDAGATEVLVKPLTHENLRAALERRVQDGSAGGTGEPPADAAAIIDTRMLAGLRALDAPGSPSFARQVIDSFAGESQAAHLRLRSAYEQGRWSELSATAHALKGAALTVGAQRLAGSCAILEWADTRPPHPGELAAAERELGRALQALRALAAE